MVRDRCRHQRKQGLGLSHPSPMSRLRRSRDMGYHSKSRCGAAPARARPMHRRVAASARSGLGGFVGLTRAALGYEPRPWTVSREQLRQHIKARSHPPPLTVLHHFPRECVDQLPRGDYYDGARLTNSRAPPFACIGKRLFQATETLPGNAPSPFRRLRFRRIEQRY